MSEALSPGWYWIKRYEWSEWRPCQRVQAYAPDASYWRGLPEDEPPATVGPAIAPPDATRPIESTPETAPRPIETAPRDGTWVLGIGDSEMFSPPHRYHAMRWYQGRWRTEQNDDFTHDGGAPTHWCPLSPSLVPPENVS